MVNTANYEAILQHIKGKKVRLVAVSKHQTLDDIQKLYEMGQRIFGENRVQELVEKQAQLPKDIEWHFIGHLQRNKVKHIAAFVSCIHAIDDWELLQTVDKEAEKCGRTIDCLLQLHIAQENTKYGFTQDALLRFWKTHDWYNLSHVRLCGLMGMATFTDDEQQIRSEFGVLKQTFTHLQQQNPAFTDLSMGMSGDYLIALEMGTSLIRVGSLLFD